MNRLTCAAVIAAFALSVSPSAIAAAQTAPAVLSPAPAATLPPVSLPEDPKVTVKAKEWLHRMQTGNIDRAQLDPKVNALITDAMVKAMVPQMNSLGPEKSFAYAGSFSKAGSTAYFYDVGFASVTLREFISFNKAGKIDGIGLRLPQ